MSCRGQNFRFGALELENDQGAYQPAARSTLSLAVFVETRREIIAKDLPA